MHPTAVLDQGLPLLRRTPAVLDAWLRDLPEAWLHADEGPNTWNTVTVVAHLIEGERQDWMPRVRHLLAHGEAVVFPPFDRFAQLHAPLRPIAELLDDFTTQRRRSLDELTALGLGAGDLALRGRHPEFGPVTLGQHLATWVAHDLTHLAQITRVMGRSCRSAVGPWQAYLRIVRAPE